MKKLLALLCVAVMLLSMTPALAAGWDCSCGSSGNSGNFCPNCGNAKPVPVEPAPAASVSGVEVGSYIEFGHYDQDNNVYNGGESIEWQVLTVQGNKALVISRYGLHRAPFHGTSSGETWYNSDLRSWLNKKFLTTAFTTSEQNSILLTEVDESMDQCNADCPPYRLGENTKDKVFLLSYAEALQYMPGKHDRLCAPSETAIAEDCNISDKRFLDGEEKTCWYWLRTPAYNNNLIVVDWEGNLETCYMSHIYGVVRPAMWIQIGESVTPELLAVDSKYESRQVGQANRWYAVTEGGEGALEYHYRLYKDGAEYTTYGWQTESSFAVTFPEAGTYTMEVRVRDGLGNRSDYVTSAPIVVTK